MVAEKGKSTTSGKMFQWKILWCEGQQISTGLIHLWVQQIQVWAKRVVEHLRCSCKSCTIHPSGRGEALKAKVKVSRILALDINFGKIKIVRNHALFCMVDWMHSFINFQICYDLYGMKSTLQWGIYEYAKLNVLSSKHSWCIYMYYDTTWW